MLQILHNVWTGLVTSTPLDQINFVLGLLGVWLMVKRTLWAFPVGLAAVSVQCVLFFRTGFPADATLQIFFFVMLAWGWWHWTRDKGAAPELPITRLSARGWVAALGGPAAGTVVWALFIAPRVHSLMPWRDAFIAMFAVAGQILQSRKNIENWPFWTVVNVVAMISYWSAELPLTSFLTSIYLVLGLLGWREWHQTMKQEKSVPKTPAAVSAQTS